MVKMNEFLATEDLKMKLDEWGIEYPDNITYQEAVDLIELAESEAMYGLDSTDDYDY